MQRVADIAAAMQAAAHQEGAAERADAPACAVCGTTDRVKVCGGCKAVWYCGANHQRRHRKEHKDLCKELAWERGLDTAPRRSWADGLTLPKQHEWLVDCYRLRVEECYVMTGDAFGLYGSGGHDAEFVVNDFLVFCKLVRRKRAVPKDWGWAAFLRTARGLLNYAFEKSDAQASSRHACPRVTHRAIFALVDCRGFACGAGGSLMFAGCA